uniref:Uncharacterized protein n=1 Tax=Physcomitrium patens TaxID=3218 RepID=A0A2K1J6F9_PHYPA|nr:hypothetical protein PHYPA_020242 [Physcomitrium patens]
MTSIIVIPSSILRTSTLKSITTINEDLLELPLPRQEIPNLAVIGVALQVEQKGARKHKSESEAKKRVIKGSRH